MFINHHSDLLQRTHANKHSLVAKGQSGHLGVICHHIKFILFYVSPIIAQVHYYFSGTAGSYSQHHLFLLQIKICQEKGGAMSEVLHSLFELIFFL